MTEIPKRLAPKKDVLRRLYLLAGNQCAYPDCNHPIILQDGTYVGELCHIRAAESGGERFDETQTNEDRRSFENLMFLCHDHHVITNDVDLYRPERMEEIKNRHESNFAKGIAGLERAEGIEISDSIVAFGGTGGSSIAAGGGGGAAIGDGARAGDGGPGGRITNFGELDLEALINAVPDEARHAGSGGRGATAIGDGAIAGDGGGGGDAVVSLLSGEMMQRIGVAKVHVRVGNGGLGVGNDGQPSGYDLIDDRGNILISVNAPAGKGDGKPTSNSNGDEPSSGISAEISKTFVKAAFFSNSIEVHESGLFSVLSGGWDFFSSSTFPLKPQWPLLVHLAIGGVQPGGTQSLSIFLIGPDQTEFELEAIDVTRDSTTSSPSTLIFRLLSPEITCPGLWVFSIRSADRELSRLPIEVRKVK